MKPVLCIVGLGYVGMPLAHAFAKTKYEVYGFDVSQSRIDELKNNKDRTNELSEKELKKVNIHFSTDPTVIAKADIVILAIPTPVDKKNKPDLTLLFDATKTVGKFLKGGAIIVYESTVYPGVTEDLCRPLLKKESGGKFFKLGYSPERINPGDKKHTVEKIMKIVAGEDEETTETLAKLYGSIVKAGIHRAPNIKVAEMAKAIENAQRDINIAYMNEIAKFCNKLGIETKDVLDAAKTKWNFLPFSPGLVGGHCIGVDPYYLLEKAKELGDAMPVVKTARETNDGMVQYIAESILQSLPSRGSLLVLGQTFKEDVPDDRNSKAKDVVSLLQKAGCAVATHDTELSPGPLPSGPFDAIILLVPHSAYREMKPKDFRTLAKFPCLFYDLKSVFEKSEMEQVGFTYMAL